VIGNVDELAEIRRHRTDLKLQRQGTADALRRAVAELRKLEHLEASRWER
jgi:hypothetical protein